MDYNDLRVNQVDLNSMYKLEQHLSEVGIKAPYHLCYKIVSYGADTFSNGVVKYKLVKGEGFYTHVNFGYIIYLYGNDKVEIVSMALS